MKKLLLPLLISLSLFLQAQDKSDWKGGVPEGCTSITVGKNATDDGSVITSHTDDSHRTRSWADIIPAKDYEKGATVKMYRREATDSLVMPAYAHREIGSIPQVKHTYQYINTAYPCMNEHQLAIGESTFGGRDELQSDNGLIDCQRLVKLMLERCTTAREAIKMAGELTHEYGWIDAGECLTIADPKEVWHFEIVGPGKGKKGAVWAAQRVPDDHVSCNANASRIGKIDLNNKDYFMASNNVFEVALANQWVNSKEDFTFCYAYAPKSRKSVAARRREWRIFDLIAPSLHLDPNDENYPFSVKPDKKVTKEKLIAIFKDYYEGTPYDMTKDITVSDKDGKQVISPLANPFMPYDQLAINDVNGGWYHVDKKSGHIDFLGERTIARWYTMYGTITQSRDWLPDEVGGVVWLAQDNIATSVYIPVYANIKQMPAPYLVHGRETGYTTTSAWWAFNRLGTLAAQRWGDIRHDVDKKMTAYTDKWGNKAVNEAVKLGDFIWTKYDEKF